jgi:glycosyltransferase involved in cell wall biosynthesis
MSAPSVAASVLICTYNRARLLQETLESLAATTARVPWEVVVVDNNSTDQTRQVVESMAGGFPVPLVYAFEGRQGKSHALNTGMDICRGAVIAFTDDDVRVAPGWVDAACDALTADSRAEYAGGPVRPIWGAKPPRWLDRTRGDLWGTLAILDYGAEPFVFEERNKVPLGANMAVKRRLIERIGGFNPELGRKGGSLLGQEQAEFFSRSRAAGIVGCYTPAMEIEHHVPAERLSKDYFRRWWFWKGVSRARMDTLHPVTELGLDLRTVPHLARVPRYMLAALPRIVLAWVLAAVRRHWADAMRQEMLVCYTLGYVRARWAGRQSPLSAHALDPVTPRPVVASR